MTEALTGHEKECALAANALRIEAAQKARDKNEEREWRSYYREILAAPTL